MDESRLYILLGKKLSNEATTGELAELENLLRDSAVNPSDLNTLQLVWNSKPGIEESLLEEHWEKLADRIQDRKEKEEKEKHFVVISKSKKSIFSISKVWVAASVAVLLTLAAGLWWLKTREMSASIAGINVKEVVIVALNGERKQLRLPDSTTVHLNSGSKLIYNKDFGKGNRQVWLEGEAFFEVTKDAAHPFLVNTKRMTVKVLGTIFNVKAYNTNEDIETTVVEGKVEVSLNETMEKKVILLPNEKIALKNKTIEKEKAQLKTPAPNFSYEVKTVKPVAKEMNMPEEIAWVKEKVVFSDEPFEMVALKMERWYNVHFHFENENVKSISMSGDFDGVSIDEALRILQLMVGFNYTIKGDEIFIR